MTVISCVCKGHFHYVLVGMDVCVHGGLLILHLRALDHNVVCLCMCLLWDWRRQNMGQEKHMALLGYDHLLLLLSHCGRFQDNFESTLVNDKENNEYSNNSSPLVNPTGVRALFWHSQYFNLENYMLFVSFFIKNVFIDWFIYFIECADKYSNGLFKQSQYLHSSFCTWSCF